MIAQDLRDITLSLDQGVNCESFRLQWEVVLETRMEYRRIRRKLLNIIWCINMLVFPGSAVHGSEIASGPTFPAIIAVTYLSEEGKRLDVSYDNIRRRVALEWEGRTVVLPEAVSASGARYTADGETVFWSKGENARFWKNDALVFEGGEE